MYPLPHPLGSDTTFQTDSSWTPSLSFSGSDAQCQDVIFDLSRLQIPVVGHAFLCGHCMLSCLYTCTSSSRHSTCQSPHNADPPDSGKPTLGVDTRKRKKYMKRHFHVFNMPSERVVAVRNILFLMMLY